MLSAFLESFLSDWAVDAVIDSVKTIPFLFFVFLFIELFEHYQANKIKGFLKHSKNEGPLIGALAASIPQCGFSVVASTLYNKGFITRGTIVAVFLATSDEAIPVLLMYPEYFPYILPLIGVKLLVAIPAGYLADKFFPHSNQNQKEAEVEHIEGCCRHDITSHGKRDFLIHPLKHTLGIFTFILILTLILNFIFEKFNPAYLVGIGGGFLTPLVTAFLGLIPNCAISVGLVLMFIKGAISFGAMVSGLTSSAGIGLLVLLKNYKNKKDILVILLILVLTGFLTGITVQFFE